MVYIQYVYGLYKIKLFIELYHYLQQKINIIIHCYNSLLLLFIIINYVELNKIENEDVNVTNIVELKNAFNIFKENSNAYLIGVNI